MLTDAKCRNATSEGHNLRKLADGGGLYLWVYADGRKYWRLRYWLAGREKALSLGVYPEVGLKEARARRDAERKRLDNNLDPAAERRAEKVRARIAAQNSFETVGREWFGKQAPTWAPGHATDVRRRLEKNIFPFIGRRPISDIDAPELLATVRRIEDRGAHDLAHRVLQVCGQVFRYGIATGRCTRDLTGDLRGALTPHKARHQAAVRPEELPELLRSIAGYEAIGDRQTRLALQLLKSRGQVLQKRIEHVHCRIMARPLRIELSGGLYHVTSRGDRREDIYGSDDDRRAWLELFGSVCARFNWVCHAYCLMTNHYHVVVETPQGNLSQGMRQLNGVYTQYANRAHGRTGHVFQGRYKAILVEKDRYLLELARYVVLNPVRAGMVGEAGEWPWSSHRAMVGEVAAPGWLQTDWLLGRFSVQRKRAIARYIEFIRAGVGLPSLWQDLRNQIYLGGEQFVERMQKSASPAGGLAEIPRIQRRAVMRPLEYYASRYRDPTEAMALAYLGGDYTMKAIAQHFGVHYSTVSRAVKEHENKARR